MLSCQRQYHAEFAILKSKLSNHFTYTPLHTEFYPIKNCRSYHFNLEGRARDHLRIKEHEKVFINTSAGLPNALNELSFKRVREEKLLDLRTRGIKEQCLEVKEFECIKYQFRDPSESELLGVVQKLDDEYAIQIEQGQTITNKIQMMVCPQQEVEISYLVQLP